MKRLTLLMLLAAPAAAGQVPLPVTHYEAMSTQPATAAVLENSDVAMAPDHFDRMTVPVTVGQSRAFNFLIDTGSDRTSVSRELVRELGLAERPDARLHSATGSSQVSMAWLPELRVSHKAVRNINAPMLDASDIGADGILGIDSLRAERIVFDFDRGQLSILSDKEAGMAEEGAILVRAKQRQGRLVVTDAEVDGQRVTVILDTGSSSTIGNLALRARIARHGRITPVGPITLVSVTGQSLAGELVNVRSLEIGGARIEGLRMVFADAHTFRLLGLDKKPAILLGMSALRGFDRVSIDFADRTISLQLPRVRVRT